MAFITLHITTFNLLLALNTEIILLNLYYIASIHNIPIIQPVSGGSYAYKNYTNGVAVFNAGVRATFQNTVAIISKWKTLCLEDRNKF